jgi:exosortase
LSVAREPAARGASGTAAAAAASRSAPALRAGTIAAAAAIATLLALIYHRTAHELWTTWSTNDTYSHGPLVPLVSLALIWRDRERVRKAIGRPDARGLWLVALACAMQITGIRADVFALQGWSLIPALFGLSLVFLGAAATARLAFPIAFLAFMLTFPPIVVNQLSFALKEVAVRLSTATAEALGVVLQRNGMTLYVGGGELRMEHPCSGLRSLIALLATGALLAWFLPGGWTRRALLLASAVPIAILSNAIRIAFLIVVAHYDSVERAGRLHDVSGYAVYALALGGLLLVRSALVPRPAAEPGREGPRTA